MEDILPISPELRYARERADRIEGDASSTRVMRQRRAEEKRLQQTPEDVAYVSSRHLANQWRNYATSPFNVAMGNCKLDRPWFLECFPPRTKVAICAAGQGRDQAPLCDPEWQVWAINGIMPIDHERRFRADVWFDLHQRCAQNADDLKWIQESPFPIFVPPDLEDEGPNARHFPLDEIEARFGVSYFACSFAYMIALAILRGDVTDLGLYGVDLAYGTMRERTVEYANTSYWIGRAEQAGLIVHLPAPTRMVTHRGRYGFEYDDELDATQEYVDFMEAVDAERRWERERQRLHALGASARG